MALFNPDFNSDFFIKTKNKLKTISNGYMRRASGGKRKIDFCYRNSEGKFIHIDFQEAILFLKTLKRRTKRESTAIKLTSNTVYKDHLITHRRTFIEKTYNEVNNHSSDIFSESNLEDYFVNDSQLRNSVYVRSHNDAERIQPNVDDKIVLDYIKMPSDKFLPKTKLPTNFNKSIEIHENTLKIIKNWLCRNPRHNLFKNKTVLPSNFTSDIKYLKDVLFALNPIISIQRLDILTEENVHDNHISKEDFANTLGLLQIADGNITNVGKTNLYHSSPVAHGENGNSIKDSSNLKLLFSPHKNELRLSKIDYPKQPKLSGKKYPINKAQYTTTEDRIIINWVLKGNNALKVNGNTIWKELESRQLMPNERSWQSLRSRFVKTILFNLKNYALPNEDEMKIKIGAQKGMLNTKKKFNPNLGLVITNKNSTAKIRTNNSPSKNTHKTKLQIEYIEKKPILKLEKENMENYNHYSDSDVLNDDTIHTPYNEFIKKSMKKNKLRKLFTAKDYIEYDSKIG